MTLADLGIQVDDDDRSGVAFRVRRVERVGYVVIVALIAAILLVLVASRLSNPEGGGA